MKFFKNYSTLKKENERMHKLLQQERDIRFEVMQKAQGLESYIIYFNEMIDLLKTEDTIYIGLLKSGPQKLYEAAEKVLILHGFQQVGDPAHGWWKKNPEGMKMYNGNCENIDITIPNELHLKECSSLLEKAGYKISEINPSAPSGRFSLFYGVYDIYGEDRKIYVEKLAEIVSITIEKEESDYIRIRYNVLLNERINMDELNKIYEDYVELLNELEDGVRIVPV